MKQCTVRLGRMVALGLIVFVVAPGITWAQKFDWQMHKGTSIRVMANKNASGEAIQSLVPDFEKLTGIKVQYETFTEDQYRQKVLLELAAGTGGVDAIQTATAQEGLKFWRSGWYEPLDEYLKNSRLTDPNYDLADISKPALAGNTYDGKLVALPTTQQTTMLYYRKDLFDKYKIKVPQTMAELEEAAKKLHNMDEGGQKIVGIVLRGKKAAATSQWAPYLLSMGGSWLTKDRKSAMNSPEAIQAFDFYGRLLRNYGPPGAVNYHWYECVSLFVQGKAAMYTDVSNRIFYFEDPAKSQVVGKIGSSLIPVAKAGNASWTVDGSECMAIAAKAANKDAAWKFIQYFTSKDQSKAIFKDMSALPVWKSVFNDPDLAKNPWMKTFLDQLTNDYSRPGQAWYAEFSQTMQVETIGALNGTKTPQQALDDAAKKAADILKRG